MNSWSHTQSLREISKQGVLPWLKNTSKPTSRLQAKNFYRTMYTVLTALQERSEMEQSEGIWILMNRVPQALESPGEARYDYKHLMELNRFPFPGLYCPLMDKIQTQCPATKSPSYSGGDYVPESLFARYAHEIRSQLHYPAVKSWSIGEMPLVFQHLGKALLEDNALEAFYAKQEFLKLPLQEQLDVLTVYFDYRPEKVLINMYKTLVLAHLKSITPEPNDKQAYSVWGHYSQVKLLLNDDEISEWKQIYYQKLADLSLVNKIKVLVILQGNSYSEKYNATYADIWDEIPDGIKKEMAIGVLKGTVESSSRYGKNLWSKVLSQSPPFTPQERMDIMNMNYFQHSLLGKEFNKFISVLDPSYASLFYDEHMDLTNAIKQYKGYLNQQLQTPNEALDIPVEAHTTNDHYSI